MSSNTISSSNNSQFLNTVIANGAASAGQTVSNDQSNSWFEALAKAWGNALDQQANKVTSLSDQVGGGGSGANANGQAGGMNGGSDNPSVLTQLTAESLKMQFLSTSASTSTNAVGQALSTLGQKQG
ncbi:hypothetical protein [Dyella choica]|uniref:Uncharacterized protein n=1 Tax=Dyella choica TaxID=1927959 RepID=A0A3S0PR69_9GAMM|nr:hypothetical protein [Dyella choica]RUL79057.1 hypothetical protein EKH80_04470 [Dyella choica]